MLSYQSEFYSDFWPLAVQAGKRTGIDPSIIFGQAALESNWGRSAPNNNFFGIKGAGHTLETAEFIGGEWVTSRESFAGYESMSDSVNAYVSLMMTPRYTDVRSGDSLQEQLSALQGSGYATDPNYSEKVGAIAEQVSGGGFMGGLERLSARVSNFLDPIASKLPGYEMAMAATGGAGQIGAAIRGQEEPGWNAGRFEGWFARGTYVALGVIFVTLGLILIGVVQKETILRVAGNG